METEHGELYGPIQTETQIKHKGTCVTNANYLTLYFVCVMIVVFVQHTNYGKP